MSGEFPSIILWLFPLLSPCVLLFCSSCYSAPSTIMVSEFLELSSMSLYFSLTLYPLLYYLEEFLNNFQYSHCVISSVVISLYFPLCGYYFYLLHVDEGSYEQRSKNPCPHVRSLKAFSYVISSGLGCNPLNCTQGFDKILLKRQPGPSYCNGESGMPEAK